MRIAVTEIGAGNYVSFVCELGEGVAHWMDEIGPAVLALRFTRMRCELRRTIFEERIR